MIFCGNKEFKKKKKKKKWNRQKTLNYLNCPHKFCGVFRSGIREFPPKYGVLVRFLRKAMQVVQMPCEPPG